MVDLPPKQQASTSFLHPSGTDIYYYCLDVSNIMSFLNGKEETEQGYKADTCDLLEAMGSYKFAIHQ